MGWNVSVTYGLLSPTCLFYLWEGPGSYPTGNQYKSAMGALYGSLWVIYGSYGSYLFSFLRFISIFPIQQKSAPEFGENSPLFS